MRDEIGSSEDTTSEPSFPTYEDKLDDLENLETGEAAQHIRSTAAQRRRQQVSAAAARTRVAQVAEVVGLDDPAVLAQGRQVVVDAHVFPRRTER